MMHDPESEKPEEPSATPWIDLKTTHDVEAWIDNHNRNLQRFMLKMNATGYGICFGLVHGGEIFMHTTQDGDILLDVTPEAGWIAPLITAATQVQPPRAQIWALPGDTLTQLVLGLSSLIASSKTVLGHDFRIIKWG
ncbi:MAG: hypothetical protein JWQ23_3114 [Herminiimonas sp.]|nr:hypothetical protein [Herminiimonas sp.]